MSAAELVAVVSHDAGGAEILSSYVRRAALACVFTLDGPARGVFTRKLGTIECAPLEESIGRASWILCGTSWQSDLEWRAIGFANRAGKRVVAFIDHWANYRERFVRGGVVRLPDEIWVGDDHAARLARSCFPAVPVRLKANPYLDDLRSEVAAAPRAAASSGRPVALYLCEPIREHALRQHGDERYWGYTEEEALEYFLNHAGVVAADLARIVIRPHPSETSAKYSWAVARGTVPIELSTAAGLVADIAAADIVVGCESMAMVVGMLAGRRVISSIPPGGRPCSLPYAEIESLAAMVQASHSTASSGTRTV